MAVKEKKSPKAYRTISEAASELDVQQHVLRFWESKFAQIKPMKRAGGRRYYRPEDIELLTAIRELLYTQGYTIKGVQKILREQGVKRLLAALHEEKKESDALPVSLPRVASDPVSALKANDDGQEQKGEQEGSQNLHQQNAEYQKMRDVLGRLKEIKKMLNAELPL
ncbi:MAG: MerR family transcriptional regulator [Kordiimonas sp.]|nr:MerR family transcriptional regulator [Kordiimonas sp.]|tara:strand:+ start:1140 stop:1640 length:501 start_codon:yes stop_codon:yes gene_type:complete